MKNNSISCAYGIYINIDMGQEKIIHEISKMDAKHKADVCVVYYGKKREFVLMEFLEKLGFFKNENKKDL